MNKNKLEKIAIVVFFIIIVFACLYIKTEQENVVTNNEISYEISNIPEYSEDISVLINNNIPNFTEEDMKIDEYYSELKDGKVRNGYDKNLLGKSK